MINFDIDEQRAFLQFVTGSPRLPVGGKNDDHIYIALIFLTNRFSNASSSINGCKKNS